MGILPRVDHISVKGFASHSCPWKRGTLTIFQYNNCSQDVFNSCVLLQSSLGLGHPIDLLSSQNSSVISFLHGIYSDIPTSHRIMSFLPEPSGYGLVLSYHRDPYLCIIFRVQERRCQTGPLAWSLISLRVFIGVSPWTPSSWTWDRTSRCLFD